MAIQGLRDSNNFATDERPKNWREAILRLYPNGKAPLTAMTAAMKSRKVDDPEFNWWEKSLPTQRVSTGTVAHTATQTAITVLSGALALKEGHLLRAEGTTSQEVMLVAADPVVDTSITVVRGYAGTTASALVSSTAGNPNLHVVGNANEEGSTAPTGINYDPTKVYNYTQIFRNSLEMTRTAMRTRLRTGDQVKEAKRECLELHSIEMEKAFWFGQRLETTRNGKPLRTTRGIFNWIHTDNVVNIATTGTTTGVSLFTLEGYLKSAFDYGSNEKMGFLGNTAMLTIQRICRKNSTYQLLPPSNEFGITVNRLVTPFGTLILKTHPLFNQLSGGGTATSQYYGVDSWLAILDMAEIMYTYVDDTKYEKDLQDSGVDGLKSGYLTEAGMEFHHSTAHYLVKGLATAIVDS